MIKNLVSILIPIHNAEKYLNEAIMSVIKQSYKKIEIICIENGSKDNSLALLKYYSKKYKKFKNHTS